MTNFSTPRALHPQKQWKQLRVDIHTIFIFSVSTESIGILKRGRKKNQKRKTISLKCFPIETQ